MFHFQFIAVFKDCNYVEKPQKKAAETRDTSLKNVCLIARLVGVKINVFRPPTV